MLGDSIARALPRLRAHAESRMTATFRAESPTRERVDGLMETVWASQGETPGRLSGPSRNSDVADRDITVGGIERLTFDAVLHLPLSAPLPVAGWEYECVAVSAVDDPAMLGRRYRVVNAPVGSQKTARRVEVVDLSSGTIA